MITSDHGMMDTRRAQTVDIEKIATCPASLHSSGAVAAVHIPDAARAAKIRDQVNAR